MLYCMHTAGSIEAEQLQSDKGPQGILRGAKQ